MYKCIYSNIGQNVNTVTEHLEVNITTKKAKAS